MQGKTDIGIGERVFHHYAGALNAVPLMMQYRRHPSNLFLLRLATAGLMGSLTNLKPDGGASMGFHGHPSLLRPDGYSADWGVGFYGYCAQVGAVPGLQVFAPAFTATAKSSQPVLCFLLAGNVCPYMRP